MRIYFWFIFLIINCDVFSNCTTNIDSSDSRKVNHNHNSYFAEFTSENIDEQDRLDLERYSNLDLTEAESFLILAGIIFIIVAIKISDKRPNLRTGFGCIGLICVLPLISVILAVAENVFGYLVTLVLLIGGFYYFYKRKYK